MIHSVHSYMKDASTKSKYVLKGYSGIYEPLHVKSKTKDEIPLYLCPVPPHVNAKEERKPALIMVNARKKYLSGLYYPLPENPFLAYGDIENDGLLVIRDNGHLDVVIFPESKHLCMALYTMYADGDPDMVAEIEEHRQAFKDLEAEKPESLS